MMSCAALCRRRAYYCWNGRPIKPIEFVAGHVTLPLPSVVNFMTLRRLFYGLLFVSALCPIAVHANVPKELRILRMTPEGEDVQSTRQIVIEFNRPVVPIGRMERSAEEIPVTFSPQVACQWRWLNKSTLSCNLGDTTELTPATKYEMTVNPGIRAEDGASISEAETHHFTTERPALRYTSFRHWMSPGKPVIRLYFNQPVTKRSVAEHVVFEHTGKTRAVVMPVKDSEDPVMMGREEARRMWDVRPAEELPADSSITLALTSGLVSALGPETGIVSDDDAKGGSNKRSAVAFDTFPEFRFLGVACSDLQGETIIVSASDSGQKCDPMASIALTFSAPVLSEDVKKYVGFTHKLSSFDGWGEGYESRLESAHKRGNVYRVTFPRGLKANTAYSITSEAPARNAFARAWRSLLSVFGIHRDRALEDAFGRRIDSPFALTFATDHRRPNFEMPNNDAVLEKNVDSELPIYVTNLDTLKFPYQRMDAVGVKNDLEHRITPPDVDDIQFAIPGEVRAMLDGKPGVLYTGLDTEPGLDNKSDGERRLLAQVTPYSVHMKLGHFSSLAWITDMATGLPVEGAKVTLYAGPISDLADQSNPSYATTDASGIALLPGAADVDPKDMLADAWKDGEAGLMLRVVKGEDIALLPLRYAYSVDIWRASGESIYPATRSRYGHLRSWGTTAQGVYRVGQTMEYKLYTRNESNRTLVSPPKGDYLLEIIDPTGKTVEAKEHIRFSEFGAYSGTYDIPEHATMGWYRFRLTAHFPELDGVDRYNDPRKHTVELEPMRVLVSDFTPASFKVSNDVSGTRFAPGDKVEVDTRATLHSGGAYTDASANIRAQVRPSTFTSKSPVLQGFNFDSGNGEYNRDVFQETGPLSDKGERNDSFTLEDASIVYGTLVVESAVEDDRGKYIASEARADYIGRDRYVGLKAPRWVYDAGKEGALLYTVADDKGEPVAGTKVDIAFEREETKAARVKGAGNAYLVEYESKWVKERGCKGTSEAEPSECRFTPEKAGTWRATATITDSKGRKHSTQQWLWVTGSDYVLWDEGENNALPLVPEKAEYKVGDTARYLIRNPYPGATALVTIERYGVLDSFTTVLEGSTPTISFEVKPDYLPGFYLSVIVTSPRVDKPHGKVGEVDLGKPTYKLGYVSVPVKDPYKEMAVTAKAEKEEYRPRDTVNVTLHAEPKKPGKAEPVEITAIVLDEAVFDLIAGGRDYFDPYKGLFTLDGLDLRNYSLLTRLIGRQTFEKKGANPGGDGGADLSMRNLFKFVAYWNPSLRTDAKGNASFSFEAPDNLTGWRVLALAATPSDRFGLGETNFKVNRPTEVRPVMPNQVMEGDSFTAQFSVMNRTDKERTLTVNIEAQGTLKAKNNSQAITKEVTLAPYKRATISLPLIAGRAEEDRDAPPAAIYFTARAGDETDRDEMEHTLSVLKRRNLITAAEYGSTDEDEATTSLAIPKDINTDVGAISVVTGPSVLANIEGAFRYLRDYQYSCWEQRLTKGVMAANYHRLAAYMPPTFVWKEADGMPQKMLNDAASFQAPGGGMAYFKALDEYADPYLSAYTALAFRWLADAGYDVPEDVEAKLHGYLLDMLRRDNAPSFYSRGMVSDVRAMALSALAQSRKVTEEDIARFAPRVTEMSLMGKAQFLDAATTLGITDTAKKTLDAILSAGIESGGKLSFNETIDDGFSRILATPSRDNCAVLSSIVTYPDADLIGDKPMKMVRAIVQSRGNRDHWENTQENVFCMNALADYARAFESVAPSMEVTASLDDKPFGRTKFGNVSDAPQTFTRPIEPTDAGRKAQVRIEREGDGRLYYSTRLSYAPKDGSDASQNAGIDIRREYSVERDKKWVLLDSPAQVKRGELVRVDLYASLPTARNFVVVNDPLPGGLEVVNRDLANSSGMDADKGDQPLSGGAYWFKFGDWTSYGMSRWSFYHREMRHDSVRFYSDYLPAGRYHLSYTAQAIATGSFAAAPTKAEEMYDPDIFGTTSSVTLEVGEKE